MSDGKTLIIRLTVNTKKKMTSLIGDMKNEDADRGVTKQPVSHFKMAYSEL